MASEPMTSESMVEKVARAIYDADNGIDGDAIADMIYESDRIVGRADEAQAATMEVCRRAARAAIAAIAALTPTPPQDGETG